jgi:protein-tyrosine phosphatase
MTSTPDRVIRVYGSHNLRDLGGLTTTDGRTVRRGRVFRSDYPAFADDAEGAQVRALGLKTVVDLRRGSEAAAECVTWDDHGVTYHRCPLVAEGTDSWHARYQAYLSHRPETVVAALRHLMDPLQQPALFHCAAGKDRTGVIAALLLNVLGVDDDEVVADYVLTQHALEPILERLMRIESYAVMLAGSSLAEQSPRAEHMQGLLDWLATRGGAETWMLEHGVPAAEVARFRSGLLAEDT